MSHIIYCTNDNTSYDLDTYEGQRDYVAKFLRENGADGHVFSCFEHCTSITKLKEIIKEKEAENDKRD